MLETATNQNNPPANPHYNLAKISAKVIGKPDMADKIAENILKNPKAFNKAMEIAFRGVSKKRTDLTFEDFQAQYYEKNGDPFKKKIPFVQDDQSSETISAPFQGLPTPQEATSWAEQYSRPDTQGNVDITVANPGAVDTTQKNIEGLQQAVYGKYQDAMSRVAKGKSEEVAVGIQKELQSEFTTWQQNRFAEIENSAKSLKSQSEVENLNAQWKQEQEAKQKELQEKYNPVLNAKIEESLKPIQQYYDHLANKDFEELYRKELQLAPENRATGQSIVSSSVSSLVRSLYQLPGDVLKGVGIITTFGDPEKDKLGLYKIGDAYNTAIQELTPINPKDRESIAVQFSGALGQAASLMVTEGMSSIGRVAKVDDFIKAGVQLGKSAGKESIKQIGSQMVRPSALAGGLQMGTYEFDDAIRAGASPDQAFEVFLKNAATGSVLERIPVMQFFNRFDKATAGTFKKFLAEKGKQSLKGGFEEFLTESMQGMYANVTAQETYDMTRKIFDNVAEQGGMGFGVGFLLNALGANVRMVRNRLGDSPQIQQTEQFIQQQLDELNNATNDATSNAQLEQAPQVQESPVQGAEVSAGSGEVSATASQQPAAESSANVPASSELAVQEQAQAPAATPAQEVPKPVSEQVSKAPDQEEVKQQVLDPQTVQRLEELRAGKPSVKLELVQSKGLVKSSDPLGNKKVHDDIKDRYKRLKALMECL